MKLNKSTFETLQIRKKVNIASNLYFTKTSYRRGKWNLRYTRRGRKFCKKGKPKGVPDFGRTWF